MKKNIFIILVILVIGLIGYYIYSFTLGSNTKTLAINVMVFDLKNGIDTIKTKEKLLPIFEKLDISKVLLKISVPNSTNFINIELKDIENKSVQVKLGLIIEKLIKELESRKSKQLKSNFNDVDSTILRFSNLNQEFKQNNENTISYYLMFGKLPDCIQKSDFEKVIKQLPKDSTNNKNNVITFLYSSLEDPEQAFFKELSKKNYGFMDFSTLSITRICGEAQSKKNIVVFCVSLINKELLNEKLSKLQNEINGDYIITYISEKTEKSMPLTNGSKLHEEILNNFDNLQWQNLAVTFKKVISASESLNANQLIIIGSFPKENIEKLNLNTTNFTKILANKNIFWVRNKETSHTDKVMSQLFKSYKFTIKEF